MDEKDCDVCKVADNTKTAAVADAKLKAGPWAYVCKAHFDELAVGTTGLYTVLADIGKPARAPYSAHPEFEHTGFEVGAL